MSSTTETILDLFHAEDLQGLAKAAQGSALTGPINRICSARIAYEGMTRQVRARRADLMKEQAVAADRVAAAERSLGAVKADYARISTELAGVREDGLVADAAKQEEVTAGDIALVSRELARWRELLASFRR